MGSLSELVDYSNRTLEIDRYSDYCPNGLQIAGRESIRILVTGVTASQRFLERAIDAGADAVLVHHGYFWKGEADALVGMKYRRIKQLMSADVALMAYHLPLDCHIEFGNNAQLARKFGLRVTGSHEVGGVQNLLWEGEFAEAQTSDNFAAGISTALNRPCLAVGETTRPIKRVAWCSGGAQRLVSNAAALGVDAFISGEISEQTTHEAEEQGIVYISAGHHATERYGVQAFGAHLASRFDVEHKHIDIDNPA